MLQKAIIDLLPHRCLNIDGNIPIVAGNIDAILSQRTVPLGLEVEDYFITFFMAFPK